MANSKQVDALGPVGARLAGRLVALRRTAGLTQAELAAKLKGLGRPILLSALSRIEKGQRRVDADDLVALALALEVSPNHLLLPAAAGKEVVDLTPTSRMTAGSAWRWATKDAPDWPSGRIFLSYAHRDGAQHARWMAEVLEVAGFEVWFDQREISVGSSIAELLREGIESSVASFVVMTPAYVRGVGSWTEQEFQMMHEVPGHLVVPVYVTNVEASPLLASYAGINLVGLNRKDAAKLLIEAAASVTGREVP